MLQVHLSKLFPAQLLQLSAGMLFFHSANHPMIFKKIQKNVGWENKFIKTMVCQYRKQLETNFSLLERIFSHLRSEWSTQSVKILYGDKFLRKLSLKLSLQLFIKLLKSFQIRYIIFSVLFLLNVVNWYALTISGMQNVLALYKACPN